MKMNGVAPVELLKRSLNVYTKQQGAIAENVANANNPDYQRLETDFTNELHNAQQNRLKTSSGRHLAGDKLPVPQNGAAADEAVDITVEMADLAVNQLHFEFSAQALRRNYSLLLSSITGRMV
ncbi:MAG: flagellar basal body rod protein FlgB [Calditrichia bacterium]